ncbi:hypothetical protein HQ520_15430 [bacterium]|nr:hypothetical protein [bacterium]
MLHRIGVGLCMLSAALVLGTPQAGFCQDGEATILYVPTADFQFEGGWRSEGFYLTAADFQFGNSEDKKIPVKDALTLIHIPRAGSYQVWASSQDYATNQPRTRRFKIGLDGRLTEKEGGTHGKSGFHWQLLDEMPLQAGDHMLTLRDTVAFFARVEGVVLSSTSLTEEWFTPENLARYHARVLPIVPEGFAPEAPKTSPGSEVEVARLENDRLRVVFLDGRADDDKPLVSTRLEMQTPKGWLTRPLGQDLFLQYVPKVDVTLGYYPHWSTPDNPLHLKTAAGEYTVDSFSNPFLPGNPQRLTPRSVRNTTDNQVEVTYELPDGKQACSVWQLDPGRQDIRFTLECKADKDGFYSVGMGAFQEWKREDVDFLEMPPVYQFQRFPLKAVLLQSSVMPHPLGIFQIKQEGQPVSLALVAEPSRLPFRWANGRNPIYGFSPVNWNCEPQPCIFSPVLGLIDSEWKIGETHSVAWRFLAMPGDWKDALEYSSANIMEVKDYRKPVNASLTGAALNIIDLLRDGTACGWDEELKGFYEIENQNMVKQASPLTLLSAAVLSHDEDFYVKRGLPSIEFVASRKGSFIYRGARNSGGGPVGVQIQVPSNAYDAAFWEGAWSLLGRNNPWMAEFKSRHGAPMQSDKPKEWLDMPQWTSWLGAYRLDHDPETLKETLKEADAFIADRIYGRLTQPALGFYNLQYYPFWYGLVELYQITGDKKYIDAAQVGGFQTIASIFSQPQIPNGEIGVHSPEQLWPITTHRPNFYRGGELIPQVDLKEFMLPKQIEAWKVAQVGLGIETPNSQLFNTNFGSDISMSVWAPHLLRLYYYTGRDIYRTYARDTIIGRFANYPGYGVQLYSDLFLAEDYPYGHGVYVGGLYYHHIAPHLSFALDYLFAQAFALSGGKIEFPYSVQKDYTFFYNWEYGTQPGEVFGEKGAVPWIERDLVNLDTIDADWLAARGPNRFYVMLMNQLHEPLDVKVQLDAKKIGLIPDGNVELFENANSQARPVSRKPGEAELPVVTIPPLGMVTLSLPAKEKALYPETPPLETGHLVQDLPEPWKKAHAFRIRGPFGKDALYVVVECEPVDGGLVKMSLKGGKDVVMERDHYPYELSVYPIEMGQDLKIDLECVKGSEEGKTVTFALPGTALSAQKGE